MKKLILRALALTMAAMLLLASSGLAETIRFRDKSNNVLILQTALQQLGKVMIQQGPVLQHTVAKAGCQCRFPSVQLIPNRILRQHTVGPGSLSAAGHQGIEGSFSGSHTQISRG